MPNADANVHHGVSGFLLDDDDILDILARDPVVVRIATDADSNVATGSYDSLRVIPSINSQVQVQPDSD